jgi:adenylate cyclase
MDTPVGCEADLGTSHATAADIIPPTAFDGHGARRWAGGRGASPAAPALDGDVRPVSIVMADLRGFTSFCERVPPERMSRVLNEYLSAMVDVILRHHGRVQDYVGDGILGVFGAPAADADHAWHAALSALAMQSAFRGLGDRWHRQTGTAFGLGVAVHSGRAFAGPVGPPQQTKYAVVGDPVNTAARLEELNRALGTGIVISGDALQPIRDRVEVAPKGLFTLRGRRHQVEVFELLAAHGRGSALGRITGPSARVALSDADR